MKLGYTIIYVPNVSESLKFFSQTFGFKENFLHESGFYGELETGGTTLAFAAHELGAQNLPSGYLKASENETPLGFEIALVTNDVLTAHKNAIESGAVEIRPVETKPWGQIVSYVRCPAGILIELCTPVNSGG